MAQRKGVNDKISTTEIQGDGSFVRISRPKVDEISELMGQVPEGDATSPSVVKASIEMTKVLVSRHLLEWDWVDDDGKALPQPRENPSVIGQLTDHEMKFLSNLFTNGIVKEEDKKKS